MAANFAESKGGFDLSEKNIQTPSHSSWDQSSGEQDASDEESASTTRHLKPADGGVAAWSFLIAGMVFEGLIWGLPLAFGVFQNFYCQLPQFADNPYISIIGTLSTGISYLGGPLMMPLIKKYPNQRRYMVWAGWFTCVVGLVAGSFANSFGALVGTQGIMYGFGYLMLYYPIISFLNEWWIQRRGMAFGLLLSATGFSGVAMPFIADLLLHKYGFRTTLRAFAVAMVVLPGPLIPLLKGRLPPSEQSACTRTNWTFLRSPLFWILQFCSLVQALGYFFPPLYLPSYATAIGLSATQGSLLLALMSITQVLGQFTFGYLSDTRLPISSLIALSTVVSALAALTLWGFARSLGLLVVFALVYGFFGAGFVSMWARMITAISDEPSAAMTILGIFSFGKGVGNVLAGPISAGLLKQAIMTFEYGIWKYKALIIFTGVMMLTSAASVGLCHTKSIFKRPS
ncbi:MAG: hypothetical protein MMC23_002225 [Stictis urceolatum]|nr:hypothetical protein [Stictis urceolata]